MRVAVITPYHGETSDIVKKCLNSVQAQTHTCTHFLVGDGPSPTLSRYVSRKIRDDDQHIVLPRAHDDYGDTPRAIGTMLAYTQGFDGVCWLDADCWFEPEHVEKMVELATLEVVSVVTASRNLVRADGSLLGRCTESNGIDFCDTNCYFVTRDAIPAIAPHWCLKPHKEAIIGDRRIWSVAKKFRHIHSETPTVNYLTKFAAHYRAFGEEPPEDARVIVTINGEKYPRSIPYREFQ